MISETRAAALQKEWSKIAGENVDLRMIGSGIYGFASELGCRRIHASNLKAKDAASVGFDKRRNMWYFCLQLTTD